MKWIFVTLHCKISKCHFHPSYHSILLYFYLLNFIFYLLGWMVKKIKRSKRIIFLSTQFYILAYDTCGCNYDDPESDMWGSRWHLSGSSFWLTLQLKWTQDLIYDIILLFILFGLCIDMTNLGLSFVCFHRVLWN